VTDSLHQTIVAIASPPGGAARGIVRISGPETVAVLEQLFLPDDPQSWPGTSTRIHSGRLRLPELHSLLPCLVYLWPTGRSYTGQPGAEIHTFGSPPLLELTVETLCRCGCRLAERGEFTLRAFLSGRIDLTQAEAVLATVDAESDEALDVALRQLGGALARPLQELRNRLLDLLAQLEAGFDYPDEDLPFLTPEQLHRQLQTACRQVEVLAKQMAARRTAGPPRRVVLVGWPNTGKSSLFNALLGQVGAIVADRPGTTRDYLTAELDLAGIECQLVDTAGLEADPASDDPLARQVQQAALEQVGQAQVQLFCIDNSRKLNRWERQQLASNLPWRIVVVTKADLPSATDYKGSAVYTSSIRGTGLDRLRHRIAELILAGSEHGPQAVASTAVRCTESLRLAADCLHRALTLLQPAPAEELVATELRTALNELGKVVGAVYTDDILDRIFSRFCVGK